MTNLTNFMGYSSRKYMVRIDLFGETMQVVDNVTLEPVLTISQKLDTNQIISVLTALGLESDKI